MSSSTHRQEIDRFTITTVVSGRYRENGYVVTDRSANASLIVDPGGRADDFIAALEESGTRPSSIVLTHGHFDHVGAVHDLTARFEIPCLVEARDQKLSQQASLFAVRFEGTRIRSPKVKPFSAPGDLDAGPGFTLDVLHTPGHTPGSVTFLIGGAAFVGDLLFRELVGPTVYPGSDQAALLTSVGALLDRAAPEMVLFAGHGRPWTVAEAREWWAKQSGNPPAMKLFGEPGPTPSTHTDAS